MKVDKVSPLNLLSVNNDEDKTKKDSSSFMSILENFTKDVNNDLKEASKAEDLLMDGNVQNFEELLYTISKSELSLRLFVEVKNKALESYQEIMRMQV